MSELVTMETNAYGKKIAQTMKFVSTHGLVTPKLPRIKFLVLSFQLYLVFM